MWWRRFGWLPLAGDSHTGEFLPFEPELGREHIAHHGDAAERAARRRQLEDCAAGKAPWQPLLAGGAWERPANVIQALRTDAALHLDMINIPNHGAIAGLPDDAVVEVPAEVRAGGICGVRIGPLPEGIAEICRQVSQVHGLVAEAAATGDRAVLAEAIRLDPAITEKAAAARAMQELLEIHADLLPQFR